MLLSLLPLLLQVWTQDFVPPPGDLASGNRAFALTYRITAFLHAEPPVRPDTPLYEQLRPDERRTVAWLDQLDPATPSMAANIACRRVAARRLRDCVINAVAPDNQYSRDLALHLVRDLRVDAPSQRADVVNVDLRLRDVLAGHGGPSICLPPFCMVEMSLPPPPPPPPPAK